MAIGRQDIPQPPARVCCSVLCIPSTEAGCLPREKSAAGTPTVRRIIVELSRALLHVADFAKVAARSDDKTMSWRITTVEGVISVASTPAVYGDSPAACDWHRVCLGDSRDFDSPWSSLRFADW